MCLSMVKTLRLLLIQSKEIRDSKLHMQSSHLWNKHIQASTRKRHSSNVNIGILNVERAQLFTSCIYITKISFVKSRGSIFIIFGVFCVLVTLSTDIPVCVCPHTAGFWLAVAHKQFFEHIIHIYQTTLKLKEVQLVQQKTLPWIWARSMVQSL